MAVAKTMHECVEVLLKRLLSPLTFFLALQSRERCWHYMASWFRNKHTWHLFFSVIVGKMVVFWCFDKTSNMTYILINFDKMHFIPTVLDGSVAPWRPDRSVSHQSSPWCFLDVVLPDKCIYHALWQMIPWKTLKWATYCFNNISALRTCFSPCFFRGSGVHSGRPTDLSYKTCWPVGI